MNTNIKVLICAIIMIALIGIVSAIAPTAQFTSSNTVGYDPLTIQFTDTSIGLPTDWYWQFGDGSISQEQNPTHIFKKFGAYAVNLTATNNDGSSRSNDIVIYVKPTFIRYQNNPILSHTDYGSTCLADPVIIENESKLNLWYGIYDISKQAYIEHAVSERIYPPVEWERSPPAKIFSALNSGWESGIGTRLGSVIKTDTGYSLYYGSGTNIWYPTQIGLARSTDGINWIRESANPIMNPSGDEISVENPWVIKENNVYRMYYSYRTNSATLPGVRYAESIDGIHWTKYPDVIKTGVAGEIDSTYIEHHQIFRYQDKYWMTYECYNGTVWRIGFAVSDTPNGKFTKLGSILDPAASGWDNGNIATPFMFQSPDTLKWNIMYQGGDTMSYTSTQIWDMGLAYESQGILPPTPIPTITIPTTVPTTVITTIPTTIEPTPTKTNCAKGKCKPTRSTGIVASILQLFNIGE